MDIKRRRASAVIIKGSKVLLIHRIDGDAEYWTFPGGGIETNETAEEAIKREVKEETNLNVHKCSEIFEDVDVFASTHNTFFLCETQGNQIQLGGPEANLQSAKNLHLIEWTEIVDIENLKLVPKSSKIKFLELYKTSMSSSIPKSFGEGN